MDATIVTKPGMRVMGITRRLNPMQTDWGKLWHEEFEPQMAVLGPLMQGTCCYGLYYDTGEPPLMDFVGAVAVGPGAEPGEGLVVRDVPAGEYACFECRLETLGQTWDGIFREWLPASEYDYDPARPCYEEFAPGTEDGRVPVRIYASIKPKG